MFFCAAAWQDSHQKLNPERRETLTVLPHSHMMMSKKPNPWRRRAPLMTPLTMPPKVLPLSRPSTSARKSPLESLNPLSKTCLVNFVPIQCVTLFLNHADAVTYEVEDPQYGYDDVGEPTPAVTQAEVHRAAGCAPEESTEDYLVPGQDN